MRLNYLFELLSSLGVVSSSCATCHLVRLRTFKLWLVRTLYVPYSLIWMKVRENFDLHLCLTRLDSFYFHFFHVNLVFSLLNKTCLVLLVELTWCRLVTFYGGLNLHLISLVRLRLFLYSDFGLPVFMILIALSKLLLMS